ncbi:MAG: protein kinase domain-containing protein, partial [Ktedonobacteraceae bacterium]
MNFIGKQIGNYRIIAEVNSGSSGRIYQAKHAILAERVVAIKLLHAYIGLSDAREQFLQEAQFLEKLRHRHILSILDVGFTEGFPYLIAEYAANGSLRDRLKQLAGHPMPLQEALALLGQIGQALEYAHQLNIIHRDLKPDNILFNAQGDALLADFGIAVVLATSSIKLIDATGTPAYMAPEQFRGMLSKESDQYALGCIAYELFTGQKPFTASDFLALGYLHATEAPTPPTHYNPQLPNYIEQALLQALAKQRAERHASVAAFITALNTAVAPKVVLPTILAPAHVSEGWLNEGVIHYKCSRYREALAAFEHVIQADPTNSAAWIGKGKSLHRLIRYQAALDAFAQAIQSDPSHPLAYNGKGHVLLSLHRYGEALAAFEWAMRLDSHCVEAYERRGEILNRLSRKDEAKVAYEEAVNMCTYVIQAHPDDAEAYCSKGEALMGLKRYTEALTVAEQAMKHALNLAAAYDLKGCALTELGRYEEAIAALEQANLLDPQALLVWANKSRVLWKFKRYEEALALLARVLERDPDFIQALRLKVQILNDLKHYEEALATNEMALRLSPRGAVYY